MPDGAYLSGIKLAKYPVLSSNDYYMCTKKISVIIVSYNVRFFLEQCLYSVRAAIDGLEAEVIVVDNWSSDGSTAYLRPKFPEVIFIENDYNPGFAKANNQAIKLCRGEYILLLNPDTVIGEESVRQLSYFMENHPEAGAIGVKMIDGTGRFLPESKRGFPSPSTSFYKLFGLSRLFPRSKVLSRYHLPHLHPDQRHQVEVLSGAFLFTRREVLDRTGLFDESFFMYGEDIDLSYRIVLAGYHNYYIPERVLHYKGESTLHNDRKYIRAFYDSMLIFFRKYYPRSSSTLSFAVNSAVSLKLFLANCFGRKDRTCRKAKHHIRKTLILCNRKNLETVLRACKEQTRITDSHAHHNLDEKKPADIINRLTHLQKYTDIVLAYPDMRFEQILLLMDKMPDKQITCHIYNEYSGRVVSPGK